MPTTKLPTKRPPKTCADLIQQISEGNLNIVSLRSVLLLVLSLILLISPLAAQEDFKPSVKEISLTYFGETITHPGISLGYAQSLKGWDKEKVKKNGMGQVGVTYHFLERLGLNFRTSLPIRNVALDWTLALRLIYNIL